MPNILIVEDDLEIAMLEQDYLEIEGFETQTVSDGEGAVSAALSHTFDLILLDLMLPGCNGYDVCRRIRDRVAEAMQVSATKLANLSAIKNGLKNTQLIVWWENGTMPEAAALEAAMSSMR